MRRADRPPAGSRSAATTTYVTGWIEGPKSTHPNGVAVTGSGDPIVAATIRSGVGTLGYVDGPSKAWIGRFSGDGELRWSVTRDEDTHQQAHAIAIDRAGEVIVVGEAGIPPGVAWIAKFDPADGSEIWSVHESLDKISTRALGVTTDSENNIYFAGQATMADGDRLWVQRRKP